MDVAAVVDDLNARLATPFTVAGRFAGGAGTGAFELHDPDGRSWVLKAAEPGPLDFDRAARTTAVLRALGYPAPETLLVAAVGGVTYAVTSRLPGTPLAGLAMDLVPTVLDLVSLQTGCGLADAPPWIETLVSTVLDGRSGYCELESLRAFRPALLVHVQRVASSCRRLDVPTTDVVHYDFTAANTLAVDGAITGVIDWEGSTTGDAAFDLVTAAFYAFDAPVRDALWRAASARTDPRALALYVAHLTLRQVDWSLRHDEREVVDWYLGISATMLALAGTPLS